MPEPDLPEHDLPEPQVANFMTAWRQLRREQPKLFDSGVRVWGQAGANMDETICLVSETDMEDAAQHGAQARQLEPQPEDDMSWLSRAVQGSLAVMCFRESGQ